jgi:hypothetical protein
MYTCCECRKPVRAVAGDAIHDIGRGKVCSACVRKPTDAPPDTRLSSEERSKKSQERWNALPDEEKARRVARLRAGRGRKVTDAANEERS